MPNQPKTTARTIRVPDDEWESWREEAKERGETISAAIRKRMKTYPRK